jgi:hypothetical protein
LIRILLGRLLSRISEVWAVAITMTIKITMRMRGEGVRGVVGDTGLEPVTSRV